MTPPIQRRKILSNQFNPARKRRRNTLAAARRAAALALFLFPGCSAGQGSHEMHHMAVGSAMIDELSIRSAWARASIVAGRPSAAYLTVINMGSQSDRLLGVTSPVAGAAQIHESVRDAGVMSMRPVDAVEIPPGATVDLKPGGTHIMLMKLTKELEAGTTIPLTLHFERAGTVTTDVPVHKSGMKKDFHGSKMEHHM